MPASTGTDAIFIKLGFLEVNAIGVVAIAAVVVLAVLVIGTRFALSWRKTRT